jgi:hypothetical protein
MTIRVGLSKPGGGLFRELKLWDRQPPLLISANALYHHKHHCFYEAPFCLFDSGVALDSAGYVAMKRYRGYPWSVEEYVAMAVPFGFDWFSQMDFCCEPEIATDRAEVLRRVQATADSLAECREEAERCIEARHPELAEDGINPMPVIQGWLPDDYRSSADLADVVLRGQWPEMVGVGSVCRRQLSGPDGIARILDALHEHLPEGVGLHLFGVKGAILRQLSDWPRVISVDSMAYEFAARMDARKAGVSKTTAFRFNVLKDWLATQASAVADDEQMRLAM